MFRGDLPEICVKYLKGENNGEPIFGYDEFPDLFEKCENRDVDFCYAFGDLICFKQYDPFNCNIQLPQEALYRNEHNSFINKAIKESVKRRNWKRGKTKPKG
jgi:hypothetical protein